MVAAVQRQQERLRSTVRLGCDALPAARLSKGQRLETHESKRALKLSRVQRSPGAFLLFFHLNFMLLYKKKNKKSNAR